MLTWEVIEIMDSGIDNEISMAWRYQKEEKEKVLERSYV